MNPEESALNLSVKTMFDYDNHTNIPWNISQYKPKKQYLDPIAQIKQKKYQTQKKGQKNTQYVTKRGFYMDYDLKVAKSIPSACQYTMSQYWDSQLKKKSPKQKVDKSLIKYTYLERIQMQQKKRKTPGIGTYNLNKTQAQLKQQTKKLTKKFSSGQKRYFYEDTQYLSNTNPGPGAHHPHNIKHKIISDRTDNKFWIAKHKKQLEQFKKRKLSQPAPGTYKNLPVIYKTFAKLMQLPKQKIEKKNGFGSDEKFDYLREEKIKNKKKEVRPSPASYNTFIEWPIKIQDAKARVRHKSNWANRISHGTCQGIYH